jgi:hypothetical protein
MARRALSGHADDLTKNKLKVFYKKTQSLTFGFQECNGCQNSISHVSMDTEKLRSEIFWMVKRSSPLR